MDDNSNESSCRNEIELPSTFPFPFTPYDIQQGFMKKLYETIELGKIGIFESPTGTGKSLSLICGSLMWLKQYEENKLKELNSLLIEDKNTSGADSNKKQASGDDWIGEFVKKQEQEERAKKLREEQEQRRKKEEKLKMLRSDIKVGTPKRKRDALEEQFDELFSPDERLKNRFEDFEDENDTNSSPDDDLVVADYMSEDEEKDGGGDDDDDLSKEEHITKIYYCSRTHSQLSQFVNEVRRSPYGEDVKVVSLGSRQNLCVNETVRKLKSLSIINDKCLDMQKNKSTKKKGEEPSSKRVKTSGSCPYHKQDNISGFTDRILVEVKDVEDLFSTGREMTACPYYASRRAIPTAQLVVLPYNSILHKSTRELSGIRLEGNILIVDEGHNLLETISNIHNVEVTGLQLSTAHSQLSQYHERFRTRLKAKNVMYIKQLLFVINNCIKVLTGKSTTDEKQGQTPARGSRLATINDFLFETGLDNLNLFKIGRYCRKSNISKKLHGFAQRINEVEIQGKRTLNVSINSSAISNLLVDAKQKGLMDGRKEGNESAPVKDVDQQYVSSPLYSVENFLEALTNADKDGRIVINKQNILSNSNIKFLMLNPAVHFAEIVEKCRSVIIAGGTMQPVSDFKEQLLFSIGVNPGRISEFSCGHIISHDRLVAISLARGSSGHELDFTFQNRELPDTMKELGRVIYNVCNVVPAGVVCFFPSYEYEAKVASYWESNGFIEKIQAKKKIFREPKKANEVEKTLQEYTKFIESHSSATSSSQQNGAILFCVVGGKMSEGINFSDDMGRCVVMVGLPYANMFSVELKEKMEYLNSNMPNVDGKPAGKLHYENLCMKAINQSIGRAIRHRNDYAAILLLDSRFLRPTVSSKLPPWIQKHLQSHERFGPAFSSLRKFFNEKKTQGMN